MVKRLGKTIISSPIITLFTILVLTLVMTWIIPAGEYVRGTDPATGATVIQSDSFRYVEKTFVGLMGFFKSIHEGFVGAADIIFMCFFSSFYIKVIMDSGAFSAGITALLNKFGARKKLIIPLMIIIVSLTGFTYGETEDMYPLVTLFVATALAAGYDKVVAVAMVGGAVMMGFASSAFNPYSIGVAQKVAELPLYSGAWLRIIIYVLFISLFIWWTMRYAKRSEPEKDTDVAHMKLETTEFTGRHKVILAGFAVVVFAMIYGALNYGWFFTEISALFLIGGFFTCLYLRHSALKTVDLFIEGCRDMLMGVTVIGLARAILVMLTSASVIDSVIHGLFTFVQTLPDVLYPIGMLIVQTLINFFIPSGSGQAAAVMPIMVPLADLLDVNRQVAVLAFQMGDGFSNMIWPTSWIAIFCGLAKCPLDRWYKFFLPFYGILYCLQIIILLIANAIGYGPF